MMRLSAGARLVATNREQFVDLMYKQVSFSDLEEALISLWSEFLRIVPPIASMFPSETLVRAVC